METITPPAVLRLPGHGTRAVSAELVPRPRALRMRQALLALGLSWAIAPVVFFLPPHLPWVLAALGIGVYLAHSRWTGTHEVRAFEGNCPRCDASIRIRPGARISFPHRLTCYACHHEPDLLVGAAPA